MWAGSCCWPPCRRDERTSTLFTDYLAGRLARSGVKVFLNEEISPTRILSLRPDAVILATGAQPCVLAVPGLAAERSLTAWDVLAGRSIPEGPCLVVGAGLVGCETADFLSEAGEKVTVVELLPEIAGDADKDTKAYFDIRFREKGRRRPHRGDPGQDGGASRRSSAGATRNCGSRPGRWSSPWGQNPTTPWAGSWPPRASTVDQWREIA